MASNNEGGHAKNIANFKLQLDFCIELGAAYAPSNAKLTVASMAALWTNADSAVNNANAVRQQTKQPLNARVILFEPLKKLVTRVINILDSTEASAEVKKDARGLADKIRGFTAKRPPNTPPEEEWVSQSQQSFVQQADRFYQLVELLKTVPEYAPNESELTTVKLEQYWQQLDASNDGIGAILAQLKKANITRNNILYNTGSGLVDVALLSKDYMKGRFGSTSEQYKYVGKLKYSRI